MTIKDLQDRPLSHSSMRAFAKSPKHFIDYRNGTFETTPAMELGTAFHKLLLEGELAYQDAYTVYEKFPRRSKADKERWAELEGEAEKTGKLLINDVDHRAIYRMLESFLTDQKAVELFDQCDEREKEIKFEIGGLPFRGFVDAVKTGKDGLWYDLKTANDASPAAFRGKFFSMDYALQHSIYFEGLRQNFFDVTTSDAWTIAVETKWPYPVSIYKISDERIVAGLDKINWRVEQFKKCMDSGAWDQGYTFNNGVITID